MADNFAVLTANGTTTATFRATDNGAGILVMMSIPTNTSGTAMLGQALMASSLPVAIASNQSAIPVSGTITSVVSGTVTAVVSGTTVVSGTVTAVVSGTAAMNIVQFGGVSVSLGQAVMATSIPVAIASNQSTLPFNLVQFGGTTVSLGQKVMATSLPVVVASDQTLTTVVSQGGNVAAVKAGTTAPTLGDAALVVAISPNSVNGNGQATMANSAPVVIASNQSSIPVAGDVASGSADSGNPVKLGAVAHTALATAVGDGQRVNFIADKTGRQQVVGAPRSLLATQTTALTTVAETTIVGPLNATTFADIYGLILANTGSTTTKIDLRYGLGSAVVMTFEVPASDTRGFMLPVDSAVPGSLSTANVSWTAQMTATTNMNVSALYVKNI